MKRKKDNRYFKEEQSRPKGTKLTPEQIKSGQRKLIIILMNTIIAMGVYFYLNSVGFWPIFIVYGVALAVISITYIVYNRGFSREKITPDMLSDKMSAEEKVEFFKSRDERKRKSEWMLTVIIPLVVTFLVDMLLLYWGPYLEKMMG